MSSNKGESSPILSVCLNKLQSACYKTAFLMLDFKSEFRRKISFKIHLKRKIYPAKHPNSSTLRPEGF